MPSGVPSGAGRRSRRHLVSECRRVNLGCLEGVDPYALEADVGGGASLSVGDDA